MSYLSRLRNYFQPSQWNTAFKNLLIGHKLTLGFGSLVIITLLVVSMSFLASQFASVYIQRTQKLRVPAALTSVSAQSNLREMQSNIRAYIATGEPEYRYRYQQTRQAFEGDLANLNTLFNNYGGTDNIHNQRQTSEDWKEDLNSCKRVADNVHSQLQLLENYYCEWLKHPNEIIALQDDLLEKLPALKSFEQDLRKRIVATQQKVEQMMNEQKQRAPSKQNMALLYDMAEFQNTFSLSVSALRQHVMTRLLSFRFEYSVVVDDNKQIWDKLREEEQFLSPSQRALLDEIGQERQAFFKRQEDIFKQIDSDRYREDLFLFQGEAEPRATEMRKVLEDIVNDQQTSLNKELRAGGWSLIIGQLSTTIAGIVAIVLGFRMVKLLTQQIASPIVALTRATESIITGDRVARAPEESDDEVGKLARAFNNMAKHLKKSTNHNNV